MSDVGKYLFELTAYGLVWYRGRVVSETEKTWLAQVDGNRPARVVKSSGIIPADDLEARERGAAAHKAHEPERKRLQELLREAEKAQRAAVIEALRGSS